MWRRQIDDLSKEFLVVTINLRGHGTSGPLGGDCTLETLKMDAISVIKGLGLTDIVLVGWYMGASVISMIVADRPSEIAAIILISPTPLLTAVYHSDA